MLEFLGQLPNGVKTVLVVAVIFIIYVIYSIRKYNTVKDKVLKLQSGLKEGDYILTQSGIYGRIDKLDDGIAWIKVSASMTIPVDRFSIKGAAAEEEKELLIKALGKKS